MGQKSCQIAKKNSQNWINIYVLPFKAMTIMASCCFSIYMDVKEFKPNPFDEILSLNFDLGSLKMNTYGIKQKSILQRTIKRTHTIKTHLIGKKKEKG
jgi:hypothetical protein